MVLLGSMMLLTCGRQALGQQEEVVPRVQITSREDLAEALVGSPDLYDSRVRLGLLAAQGSALLPWLREIASDDGAPNVARANALSVLALLLDSVSVTMMVELTRHNGPLQGAAYNALAYSPYPEACSLWRSLLRDPSARGAGTIIALGAIRFCGTAADTALIEAAVRRRGLPGDTLTANRSITALRHPLAVRYEHTPLEGNYPPSGTYRPPPGIAAEIRAQLCDGPCPAGMVVLPSMVAKLRKY